MIELTTGDMFATPVDIRVNSVNCKGVMGAGVALAFKQRYPEMFKVYQRACRDGSIRPGALHVWKNLEGDWIINFPTKRDWREPSRYEDILSGLKELRGYLKELGSVSVALPALGCGHGGLDWVRVSSMIKDQLGDLDARIFVYQPTDSHEAGRETRIQPTAAQISALESFGFHIENLSQRESEWEAPSIGLFKGDPSLLDSRWIALLPSKSPSEREREALKAVARQMAEASNTKTVALVHATRATEEVAELLLEHKISVVMILPFGPLTRKKIAKTRTEGHRASFAMISIATPEEHWSRSIFARSMTLLRDGALSVLVPDPEPKWLTSKAARIWADRAVFYIRYGSLPESVSQMLDEIGARPIGRNANTGEPNLGPLLEASRIAKSNGSETDTVCEEHFEFRLTAESAPKLLNVATTIEQTHLAEGLVRITVPRREDTEDLRAELHHIVADSDDPTNGIRHARSESGLMNNEGTQRHDQRGPYEPADLAIVEKILQSHGLTPQRFTKAEMRAGRTPDYRVMRGDALVAFCEVKSPRDDWLDDQLDEAAPGQIVGGLRDDPVFNRLSRIIEKAASQFDAVNADREFPNVLFLVNHDTASDYGDLRETLTGMFFAEDGTRYPTVKHVSEGKIKEAKFRIDAYAWFDRETGRLQGWMFSESKPEHVVAICSMFGLDWTKVVQ